MKNHLWKLHPVQNHHPVACPSANGIFIKVLSLYDHGSYFWLVSLKSKVNNWTLRSKRHLPYLLQIRKWNTKFHDNFYVNRLQSATYVNWAHNYHIPPNCSTPVIVAPPIFGTSKHIMSPTVVLQFSFSSFKSNNLIFIWQIHHSSCT